MYEMCPEMFSNLLLANVNDYCPFLKFRLKFEGKNSIWVNFKLGVFHQHVQTAIYALGMTRGCICFNSLVGN